MNSIAHYFQELTARFGSGWNRFWFAPADPLSVCLLRILTGLLALWYLLSFTTDLIVWFGPDGLMPVETVRQLTTEADGNWNARPSYLYFIQEPGWLWAAHVLGIAIVAAYTVGLATRVTSVLALGVVLSYIHRAPSITGQMEPVLTLLLFYLCLSPCGRKLSMDRWLRKWWRKPADDSPAISDPREDSSLAAGICLRLIQVHIAAMYLMMGLIKLGGSTTWWSGEAVWWLLAHSESRLIDLTSLAGHEYVINFWTHAAVVLELFFGLFIWNRWARPILLGASVVHWLLIGLITGLLSFAAAMLVANLAFLPRWSTPDPKVSQ